MTFGFFGFCALLSGNFRIKPFFKRLFHLCFLKLQPCAASEDSHSEIIKAY